MNTSNYKNEVLRQLNNRTYYEKVNSDPSELIKQNIYERINEMKSSNSHVTDQFDTFPVKTRTPVFYVLPKTHKPLDKNLPLQYPGRPIVSVCNFFTENISKYIDYVLKPLMFNLPSFVKDTSDFITQIKGRHFKSNNTFLVTLDYLRYILTFHTKMGLTPVNTFLRKTCTLVIYLLMKLQV